MQQAAAEGVRVLATREPGGSVSEEACRSYVLRRLASVPNAPAFHVGGDDGWEIGLAGDASSGVAVEVVGRVRPLPVVGVVASAFGETDGDDVVLRVRATGGARPGWLEGGYEEWTSVWG